MLNIKLKQEHFKTMMYITNNNRMVNKRDIMPYLEKFFSQEEVNSIKASDSELLYFRQVS